MMRVFPVMPTNHKILRGSPAALGSPTPIAIVSFRESHPLGTAHILRRTESAAMDTMNDKALKSSIQQRFLEILRTSTTLQQVSVADLLDDEFLKWLGGRGKVECFFDVLEAFEAWSNRDIGCSSSHGPNSLK